MGAGALRAEAQSATSSGSRAPAQRVATGPTAPFGYPSPWIFAAPQSGTPTVEGSISYDGVWANGFTSSGSVTFTIRQSPGGTVLATGTKTADSNGNAQFNRWQDHSVDLTVGMQVSATDDSTSTTKSVTLVAVSVTTVNMTTNVVTGTAPVSSPVHVDVGQGMSWTGFDTAADGTGHWSIAASFQITPDMQAIAKVSDPDGDMTSYGKQPARITGSWTQDNFFVNEFAPNASIAFTIRQSPGGTELASGARQADDTGNVGFSRGQDFNNVDLKPGMQITASDGAVTKDLTLADLAITSVDPPTDDVSGTAPPGAQVQVNVNSPGSGADGQATADGSGHWTVHFGGSYDITYRTNANATVSDTDGDQTQASRGFPTFSATLTGDGIQAWSFVADGSVTFTIRQSPGGTVLAQGIKQTDDAGNVQFLRPQDHGVDLVPGMQVTVTDGTITKGLTLAGVAVTSVNPATDVVTGTAPSDAQVTVGIGDVWGVSPKQVTAGPDGNWSVDFTDTFDITFTTSVGASVADTDGDTTSAERGTAWIEAWITRGDSVFANSFAANSTVTFTIRQSPGGDVLASGQKPTDGRGNAQFNRYQDHDVDLAPGMQVTVTDGTVTKGLTLVGVTIDSVNVAADVVTGTAPADAAVQVDVNDPPNGGTSQQVTANVNGNWSADFGGMWDVTYATYVGAKVRDGDGDATAAGKEPAFIHAGLRGGVNANNFAAGGSVTFTIRESPGGTVLAQGTKPADGAGYAEFNRWQDFDVGLVPGMQVTVSDGTVTKDLTLADISISSIGPAADVVAGTAPPGTQVQVDVNNPPNGGGSNRQVTADVNGDWSASFAGSFDITYGTHANAFVQDDDGDQTSTWRNAAQIHVGLSWDGINAEGFAADTGVTFTIRESPGGAVLATGSKTSDSGGNVQFDRWNDFDVDLVPGLQVTVTDGTLTKELTLAAIAITSVDPATEIVTGTAPAAAQVNVNVGDDQGGTGQTTTADTSGHWSIDFSPFDITYSSWAHVEVSDADGDTTARDSGPTTIDVGLTWDSIMGNNFAAETDVSFTIYESPGGAELASGSRTSDGSGYVEFDRWDAFDVDLVPGMQVTVSDGTTTKQLTLVALGVGHVDPATDTVSGTAAPGAQVRVDVGDDENGMRQTTTANGLGHWSIDFSPFDITYWMNANVGVADNDGDTTNASKNAPQISSNLVYDNISAQGFVSDATVTFTIREAPGGAELATGSKASNAAGEVGFDRWQDFDVDLVPGMQVTVTDGTVTKQLTLAALAITSVDPATDTVSGTAAPGGQVDVNVGYDQDNAGQTTTADTSGHWSVDFSPFDITYLAWAHAQVSDDDGDSTQADGGPTTIDVSLTWDVIWGNNFAADTSVTFAIREAPGGAVLDSGSRTSDGQGNVQFDRWDAFDVDLLPGMQVTVSDGTTTKQVALVAVGIGHVDPTADVVSGTAAPGAEVWVDVGDDQNGTNRMTTASGTGYWSIDFSDSFDITYRANASAHVSDDDGDRTSADKSAPQIWGNIAYDGISAQGFASGANVSFTIRQTPGGAVVATGSGTSDEAGNVDFWRGDGWDVDLLPGMQVTVTDGTVTKQLTLVALGITHVDPVTDTVAGTAPVGAQVQVDVADDNHGTSAEATADGAGHWSIHFSEFDITYTMGASAHTADADGDQTAYDKSTPRLDVELTSDIVWAGGFAGNASVSFTIRQTPGGAVLASGSGASDEAGNVEFDRGGAFSVDLAPGMQVTVTDGTVTKQLTLAAVAVTSVDLVADTVAGTAPPNAVVHVGVGEPVDPYKGSGVGQDVTAGAGGNWSVDFSPFDITPAMTASAGVEDSDSDATWAHRAADITPPVATIGSGPSGPTNDSTPTFTFSANEPSTFECKVDSGNWASCTSPFTTAVLADGAHTFQVRATDAANNLGAPVSRSFTVDTVAPQTTIDAGPSGPTNDSTPSFTFSSSEGGSSFQCRVDSGSFASCSSPYTPAALADGAHTVEVKATDPAGNTDATPASRSFTVDTVAPQTAIDSGPSGTTGDSTPTFTFSSSEAGSSFQCRVDSGSFVSCTSPYTTSALADGAHTFDVKATDAAGNTDASPASRSFTVDTSAPETTIDSGPSGPTNDSTPTFTFSSSASGSTFQCRIDSGSFAACTSPHTTAVLTDGAHTFEVRATNPLGSTDPTPASRSFTVDTVAPDTTVLTGPGGLTNNPTPSFTFSASEGGSSFQCRVDSGSYGVCTSPYTTAVLADGSHTFYVRSTDPAGNSDATPASRSFTVDTIAPDTTVLTGPSGPTNTPTPSFTFSASESGSSFQCRIDAGTWASCTSPYTTAALADGVHTFYVRATDAAGNTDTTPVSRSFTVDTIAPQTTIDWGPSGPTRDNTPGFGFSSDEPGATFECRVDGGSFAACVSPKYTGPFPDGAHTFEVRATDPAGNRDATPAVHSFTVDATPPQTTIDSGPSGPTNDSTPTFTFSSSENGSSFQCRVDGAGFAACSSPYTPAALADGAHTFDVRATDQVGNVDPTPASRSFTVDTVAPQTTIDSGPGGPTNDPTPTFSFSAGESGSSFQCRIDSGSFTACSSPHTSATLADGAHSFEVKATDAAGNTDATPASRSFTVDTVAPETAIDSGPTGVIGDSTPTFTFSSEAGASFHCRVDSGSFTACSSPHTTATLADGPHTFEVRAVDAAGNADASPASRSFTVDTGPPETTIDSGPAGLTNDSTPTFGFSASEPSTFECKVDSGNWASCTSPYTAAALADGAHTLQVRATDSFGNVDPTPASRAFTVDTVAPQTTIDSGPTGLTTDSTPTFAFSSEAGAGFQCRIDSGSFVSCTSPYTAAALADGAHGFEVKATDAAGNTDATPASRSFTVDTVAPVARIDAVAGGLTHGDLTNDPTPTFTLSSNESGSSFQCRIDSGSFVACSSPWTTGSLADGRHTFQLKATDPAGNVGAPASRSFTVDTLAPETTILSGPEGTITTATATFSFSASETATFECRLDGAAFATCTSPYTTPTLAVGPHSFHVRATDTAENVDATPASRSFGVATARTSVKLVSRTVTVTKSHVAAIKLRCGPADCQGKLTLSVTVRSNGHSRTLQIGSKSFSIAAAHTGTVNVKLTAKGYKLLVQKRKLAAKAKVSYQQPDGSTSTTTASIILKAPKR